MQKKKLCSVINNLISDIKREYYDRIEDKSKFHASHFFGYKQLRDKDRFPTIHNDNLTVEPYQQYAIKMEDFSKSLFVPELAKDKYGWDHTPFVFITNGDIYELCIGIINAIFNNKLDQEYLTINFHNNPRETFKTTNKLRSFDFKNRVNDLNLVNQVITSIEECEEFYSKIKAKFQLSFQGSKTIHKMEIANKGIKVSSEEREAEDGEGYEIMRIDDDRIVLKRNGSFFNCEGNYKGSGNKIFNAMEYDLNLLRSILEYLKVISFNYNSAPFSSRQSLMNNDPCLGSVKLEIQAPYSHKEHVQNYRKKDFQWYTLNYSKCSIHKGEKLFRVLSESFSNKKMPFILNYFKETSHVFPMNEFIQYWMAIEIMLGSPQKNIKETLKHTFYTFFPHENKEYFDKIYQVRCDIVHNGKLGIPQREIENLKTIARKLFDHQLKGAECDWMSIKEFEDF